MLGNRSEEAKKIICTDLRPSPFYWWAERGLLLTTTTIPTVNLTTSGMSHNPDMGVTPVSDYFHFV